MVQRVKRASINGARQRLAVRGKEPGYTYRIVNDVDDRVQTFMDRGYEIVTDPEIQVGDKRVSTPSKEGTPHKISVGRGLNAYVMRIKDEWAKEDAEELKQHNDNIMNSVVKDNKSNFYGKLDIK